MVTAADDTSVEKANWHWRNSMRPVRFFNLDARASLTFLVFLFYIRLHSFIITLAITMVFYYCERKGLTFPAALRTLRVWLIGRDRPGWLSYSHRRLRDFG